jgi:hypothetical protein
MKNASRFVFATRTFDRSSRVAEFTYEVQFEDAPSTRFTEQLAFPVTGDIRDLPVPLVERFLEDLHLIIGVSYWKLYCPHEIDPGTIRLSPAQAEFWHTLYTIGMGEFHYRNNLDFRDIVSFPAEEDHSVEYFELSTRDRALVGIGGGKDSIVSGELVRAEGYPFEGFVMEGSLQTSSVDPVAERMGIALMKVTRTMDPHLSTLTDVYRGHVPISAIYAFVGIFVGALYDYRYVIVSNEASSNEGNVSYLGKTVNHQWSKSVEFERMFREYTERYLVRGITYFSLLRPLSELRIVELFATEDRFKRYFDTFSSCNRNFRVNSDGSRSPMTWCGECAKCAFAFAMLAAFLPRETVVGIFKKDLFADDGLQHVYAELLGIRDFKPFDCVGTPDEVKTAFFMARERGEFAGTPMMRLFEDNVLSAGMNVSLVRHAAFAKGDTSLIPEPFLPVVETI